ncbi:hypothetical protein AA0472_2368 [Acetobacter estunensis NRIC 0472]|uniref:Uncharacterized protein n=1 Tax=Acetobacter estunensis TaxID=104097 RepID=A0A967BAJ8_9PROT|nr:hypothetical protein [Acetobacter estunensis]NHO55181.1 hypothetical protein [Acetobacter estunensis]GBQ27259.1 hypothetical protein AA0472_2368 [Acetobacter estunensis NRIC 0472]
MSAAPILCERLRSPPLVAEQFTPTTWSSAADKARIGNAILRFLAQGMPAEKFNKALYGRVSQMWSHIAHFNSLGFRSAWFASAKTRHAFLKHMVDYPCWGDPAFTWSDVEREIGQRVRENLLVEAWAKQARDEEEAHERAMLEMLMKKHGVAAAVPVVNRPAMQLGLF